MSGHWRLLCSLLLWSIAITSSFAEYSLVRSNKAARQQEQNQKQTDASSSSHRRLAQIKKEVDKKNAKKKKMPAPLPREETLPDYYVVLEVLPHDPHAFTQGLTYDGKNLYESTGLFGKSTVRHVEPQTGKVLASAPLHDRQFGEGLAYFETEDGEGRLIQITWQSQKGFIYDSDTFEVLRKFKFETSNNEGWGITYDFENKEFVVSDGSAYLLFWDRDTLKEKRRVEVMQHLKTPNGSVLKQPVRRLNELEWFDGFVLANVWYKDVLLRIDPKTGLVVQTYDFAKLYTDRARHADCFNGISVTDKPGELWVTGKLWPYMYRIELHKDNDNDETEETKDGDNDDEKKKKDGDEDEHLETKHEEDGTSVVDDGGRD
eukprot:CAMPEP_0116836722 /NCGR_PEP_ID=MMETSP0418-20121206/8257_1 /TAXON_ID=1158023 /ORGANISM="Astrosyne radiata, Strain 13vi08-1A" /LENGTH=374 /DNA_ID=CAMNT_0004466529 /DNA_START=61 /DNA_END=1185 /DNA_ORIENTATION=+